MSHTNDRFPVGTFISSVAERHGYLTPADVALMSSYDYYRVIPVLVRCGGTRFACPAEEVSARIEAVEAAGDYVRDVSLAVGSPLADAVSTRIRFDNDL
jgi:hypothetical protein